MLRCLVLLLGFPSLVHGVMCASKREDVDCNGNDLKMFHDFGLNYSACCQLCAADSSCQVAVLATDQGGVCMLKSACPNPSSHKNRVQLLVGGKPPAPVPPPSPAPPPVPPPQPLVPAWAPTYKMSESTIIMPCNYSGLYDFDAYPALARFGLVDYDWSNGKMQWANQAPMTCQATMVEQAARNKAKNPKAKIFVYRNIVKALPWFEEVREKLEDPAYWGWFLHYKPELRNGTTAGGNLYHDQEQTPGWPGGGDGGPDGVCHNNTKPPWGKGCDCGKGVPCGEYLWDHRNRSLTKWLADQHMAGKDFGLGNPNVDGYYLDDHWSSEGPSEEDKDCVQKMGLSKKDVADVTAGWSKNMKACQQAIVDNGGFNWQLFRHTSLPSQKQCASFLRDSCKPTSDLQTTAVQYGLTVQKNNPKMHWGPGYKPIPWGSCEPHCDRDVALFLMSRGPFAWLGYGWMGCGCGWENGGTMDCGGYPRPEALDVDYGEPLGLCTETKDGVFVREWTKATVHMDCNTYVPTITMKNWQTFI